MKRLFLFLSAVISAITVTAQPARGTLSLIPHVGVSIASLSHCGLTFETGLDHTFNTNYKLGFTGGLDLQYQFTPVVAVSVGASYTQAGSHSGDFENTYQNHFYGVHDIRFTTGYVDVPVLSHIYVVKNFSVNAGLQASFLTNAKLSYETTAYERLVDEAGIETGEIKYSQKDAETKIDKKDEMKSTQFYIPLGVSVEYENVVIDGRYNIPLTKNDSHDFYGKNKIFQVTVGYKFNL